MNRADFDARIDRLLLDAETLIPTQALPALPAMEYAPTVPSWYGFEHQLWGLGEDLRQLILAEKKDLNAEQTDRICRLCENTNAKRGRQSFVLLLGKKRFLPYADRIAPLLPDADISGQVISTLYKMGAAQYVDRIKPYTEHRVTWIKNEAKKYLQKYGA